MPYNLEEFKQWLKANSKESLLPLKTSYSTYNYHIQDEQLFWSESCDNGSQRPPSPVTGQLAQIFEAWKKEIDPKNKNLLEIWKKLKQKLKKASIHNYPIMNKRTILGLHNHQSNLPLATHNLVFANGEVIQKSPTLWKSKEVVEIHTELLRVAILEYITDGEFIKNYAGEIERND